MSTSRRAFLRSLITSLVVAPFAARLVMASPDDGYTTAVYCWRTYCPDWWPDFVSGFNEHGRLDCHIDPTTLYASPGTHLHRALITGVRQRHRDASWRKATGWIDFPTDYLGDRLPPTTITYRLS